MVNKFVLIVILVVFFASCSEVINKNENEELIKKLVSKDKNTIIKLVRSNVGGATIGYKYELKFINSFTNEEYTILVANKVNKIDFKWEKSNSILLNITSSRISYFTNHWYNSQSEIMYFIKLRNQIIDSDFP